MDKEIVGVHANPTYIGVIYTVTRSPEVFEIKTGIDFVKGLTNPLKTIDSTIGGMHYKQLHDSLDEWISNAIKGEVNG